MVFCTGQLRHHKRAEPGLTNPNDSVAKVDYNGTSGQKTGPSLLLKVMSADTVSIAVQSFYNTNTITTTNSSFNDVLNALALGIISTPTGAAKGSLSDYTSSGSPVYSGLSNFLSNVTEVNNGLIGKRAACAKHGLNRNTLALFIKKFSIRILGTEISTQLLAKMTDDQKLNLLEKKVKELTKYLDYANLKKNNLGMMRFIKN